MATKTTDKGDGEVLDTPTTDSPLLDLSDQAVKRMIKLAKKRGFVTHEEINEVLPSEEVTSDQIEDVFAMLNDMGINVVEQEEAEADAAEEKSEGDEEEETGTDLVEATRSTWNLLAARRYAELARKLYTLVAEVTELTEKVDNALQVTEDVYLASTPQLWTSTGCQPSPAPCSASSPLSATPTPLSTTKPRPAARN